MKPFTRAIALALPLSVVACAGGGGDLGQVLGDILGGAGGTGGGTGSAVVEVQGIDQQRQEIEVLTEDGQRGPIRYDQNTTVVYQNQQYPVTALEAGDVVEMRLQQLSGGGYYTDYITVRQSVQDRGGTSSGGTGQLVQASGTVRQIDYQRGLFTLQTTQGTVTVALPYNPSAGTVDRFESLDSGERVTVEGYVVGTGRIELVRFR
ncbi:MAG TPA: hypothetical protein VF039_02295 [Longimicrobiales bacterium]